MTLYDSSEWSSVKPQPPKPTSNNTLRDRDTVVDLNKIIQRGNDFLDLGTQEQIPEETIQNLSDIIYNTLLTIGIILAVIVGMVMAIKFITSGLDGKAEVKQLLLPYGVGVVVLFGAFTIWKIVLTILQS